MRSKQSFPALFERFLLAAMFGMAAPAYAQKAPMPVPFAPAAASASAASVISRPGSYVLNRNIVVKNPKLNGVNVNVPNVTIDLQGFTISGPGSGTGIGIDAPQNEVVIKNGMITGMGGPAVVVGNQSTVSGITASGNSGGSTGVIAAGDGSVVSNNLVSANNGLAIACTIGCLARGNTVQNNSGGGIRFNDATNGYAGNVLQQNGGAAVTGGTQIGQNLCNGSLCP
jgi:hypothetical protein